MNTRRRFFGLLIAMAVPAMADARGRRKSGSTSRKKSSKRSSFSGGCGTRGGPGWRRSDGKCASHKD